MIDFAGWKLKVDIIAIIKQKTFRVSAVVGDLQGRSKIESSREKIEQHRKRSAIESAHWDIVELNAMTLFERAQENDADAQTVNGIHLFSLSVVNRLFTEIYKEAEIVNGYLFAVR